MVKRVKKILGCLVLLIMLGSLSACSLEELLSTVPETVKLELEEATLQQKYEIEQRETPKPEQTDSEGVAESGISFLSDKAYLYAYKLLPGWEQVWYNDIAAALGSMQETVKLSEEGLNAGLDADCIDRIFQSVLNDHPELFYVSGYHYTKYYQGDTLIAIEFTGKYEMELEEALARKQEIEQTVEAVLSGIDMQASEYDKVKYVYETIVLSTEYELDAPDNQNIYSVFVGQSSVCQGYAKAAQYLLNRLEVPCTLVQGQVGWQGHAWNLVQVDGSHYYMDVTWGDASYELEEEADGEEEPAPEINYDYLCITTEQLLKTHDINNCVPMPECVDMDANYYIREDAYFESHDAERIQQLVQRSLENGRTDVAVKCADEDCYEEMLEKLIKEQEIFDYLADVDGTVTYVANEELLTLSFWVTN